MTLARRRILHLILGASALAALPGNVRAQDYPTRPITLVVTFPAGSAPDIIARLSAQYMSERLGQTVIVENDPAQAATLRPNTSRTPIRMATRC